MKLFEPYQLGTVELKNRIVMAPMTRSRAVTNNTPNELIAQYYGQRAGAGLIITEGTSPSPNGLGYQRIPGAYSKEQAQGWKLVADAVHTKGGKLFVQLMHTGRIGHPLNLPAGAQLVAPSAIKAAGFIFTDKEGKKDYIVPKALGAEEVQHTKQEFIDSAKNVVVNGGVDGVELHGANGYLLEQFLNPHTNQRTDEYGGNIENRARFVVEVVAGIAEAFGKDKVGIRFSPYGTNGDMALYEAIDDTYEYLAKELNKIGIAYIHIGGVPETANIVKGKIRNAFKQTIILNGDYDKDKAERDIAAGKADLIAFGRPFINNPDFAERIQNNLPLNTELKMNLFYTAGGEGYVDYPAYQ